MTRRGQHSHKAEGVDVFVALHLLHFSRNMIAQATGFTAQYVGEVLHECGYHERWDRVDDVKANVFIALHKLHLSRSIIAKLTGFSAAYVGQVLRDCGYKQRWDNIVDMRADLSPKLLEACAQLLAIRSFATTSIA